MAAFLIFGAAVATPSVLLGLLLLAVDGADERAALGGECRLRVLGVAEFAATVAVASRFDHPPRRVHHVEAVLGIGGQRAAEGRELRRDRVAALVGLVLEDGVLTVAIDHRHSFEDLVVPRNAEGLPEEFIERWVVPYYRATLGNLQEADVETFASGAREITVGIVRSLLGEFDWRPRITAAYFAAINGYQELEELLGTHLLKSEVCYAGTGYCLALVSFATEGATRYLHEYLDHYLGRPELWFDQGAAFCALKRLDPAAAETLRPRWSEYVADKPSLQLTQARADLAREFEGVEAIRRRKDG